MSAAGADAVLLVSHGTVDDLDDLDAFVANVRGGRPAPPGFVGELRRRYEAVGGSPLNAICAAIARKLADRLRAQGWSGVRVAPASRLWRPSVRDVLTSLAAGGATRAAVVPLAQHSGPVYADDARRAAGEAGIEVACAPSWGRRDDLCAAFAARIGARLDASPDPARTTVLMTAHSLPRAVVDAGDPYERDVRAAAGAIAALLGPRGARADVAFQSQGVDGHGAWLGPDVTTALGRARARGDRHVVLAPIGFLSDHVEVLYDLDVEARREAESLGLSYARAASLNADDDLVGVLAAVAAPLLGPAG